jgi:hypothetical protein
MDEHDPLMGVCTERKTESMGGEQREVNGNNRQFFSFSLCLSLFLSFILLSFFLLCSLTRTHIHTRTLSLLGQITIEIADDYQPSGHSITYIKDLLIISRK